MSHRAQRIGSEMQKELSQIIRNLKDPRVEDMISVTEVEVSKDLSIAKVFVSIYGGDDDSKNATLAGLIASSGFVRKELAKAFKSMHHIPEVRFVLDGSMDYAQKINKLIDDTVNTASSIDDTDKN